MKRMFAPALFAVAAMSSLALAVEPVDHDAIARIRAEAFNNSQVMDMVWHMTDLHGPRLTGSPEHKRAQEWARDTLAEHGLQNARLEPWGEFGRGWSFQKVAVELTHPTYMPMIGHEGRCQRRAGDA